MLFILCFILYAFLSRVSFYHWFRSNQYHYDFNLLDCHSTTVTIKKNKIECNDLEVSNYWDSVILHVNVKPSILSLLFLPKITFTYNEQSYHQWLEYNAKGPQYICLSFLHPKGKLMPINISSAHVSLIPTCTLHFFNNGIPPSSTSLIISPHPDDAELSSFKYYSQNYTSTTVVTITAGESGIPILNSFYTDPVKHYLKKGQLRTWNSLTIPQLAQIPPNNILNLGYFDSTLKAMHDDPKLANKSVKTGASDLMTFRKYNTSTLLQKNQATATWEHLINDISSLILTLSPDVIILPDPVMDCHPDHIYSTKAVVDALMALNIKKGDLFFYTIHHHHCPAYPFGHTGGIMSLPPNTSDIPCYFKGIYSNHLTQEAQKDKLFALESFYVLRLPPSWLTFLGMCHQFFNLLSHYLTGGQGHFKRNIRSNELFLRLPIKHLYTPTIYNNLFKPRNK